MAVRQFLVAAGITVPNTYTDDMMNLEIQSVVGDFQHKTGRQFVPGCSGEIRFYDGSGTGEQVVDEYIEITDVAVLMVPPMNVVSTALNYFEVVENGKPKTRIGILQGPANFPAYWTAFPGGRSNIQVTGKFGYASEMPAEVYNALLKMSAGKVADTLTMSTKDNSIIGGRVVSWTEADVTERYADQLPSVALGWAKEYDQAILDHMKPRKKKSRRLW
jgi:hypothetical protein